ncbi:MAG: DNA-binding protein WhiA [Solobacterium sp.]|nr:DNA-binding protein WhiA [Solobacterium sp.]
MSFTSDVKQEVSLNKPENDEARAELSALIKMTSSISISSRGMALAVETENGPVSRAVYRLMKDLYSVDIEPSVRRRMNLNKNLIYSMKIYGPVREILEDLGLYSSRGLRDRPLQKIVAKDSCARAYLAGAFMADGSVNSPQTSSYHLEIKCTTAEFAEFIIDLMGRFYIPARQIERRGKHVVYIKAAEKIGDFLRCIGAVQCLMEFENERISRDFANNVQRLNNVDVANEVKSMKAAGKQLEDIAVLEEYDMIRNLDEKLRDIVELRKENPEATLNELSELYRIKTGSVVSKSGMKHRFVRIHEMAEKARNR